MRRLRCSLSSWMGFFLAITLGLPVAAHETDQFTVAPGRSYADVGTPVSRWAYDAIARGVERINARISAAGKNSSALVSLHSDQEVVPAVNSEFPWAMEVIEGWERRLNDRSLWARYPGQVLIYQHPFQNIYQGSYFFLDPRQIMRIWNSGTCKVFGTYLGTDKIGHFTDMGMNYWRTFNKARAAGASLEEATRRAIDVGVNHPILSEKGPLGYATAGAYSNGDMAANYLGFLFYRNLTVPVVLRGRMYPPLLVRDGTHWRISPDVDRDTFFARFIDDHMDEVLNPSHYEAGMRNNVRKRIEERASNVLEHYRDLNGQRRPREWFARKHESVRTYYGVNYGHHGPHNELLRVADICFADAPSLSDGQSVLRTGERANSDWGSTGLHFAARDGNLAAMRTLLARGANVNASNDRGVTPLHLAVDNARTDAIALLLASGASPNAVDVRGRTPLHWAARQPHSGTSVLAALLDARANPNARDHQGRTPLHFAADARNAPAIDRLVARGATPGPADRLGVTPLHLAAARDDLRAVNRLLAAGADVGAVDAFGSTALHDASRHQAHYAVAALLRHGGDTRVADAYGRRALDIARQANDRASVALLNDPTLLDAARTASFKTPPGVRGSTPRSQSD